MSATAEPAGHVKRLSMGLSTRVSVSMRTTLRYSVSLHASSLVKRSDLRVSLFSHDGLYREG